MGLGEVMADPHPVRCLTYGEAARTGVDRLSRPADGWPRFGGKTAEMCVPVLVVDERKLRVPGGIETMRKLTTAAGPGASGLAETVADLAEGITAGKSGDHFDSVG